MKYFLHSYTVLFWGICTTLFFSTFIIHYLYSEMALLEPVVHFLSILFFISAVLLIIVLLYKLTKWTLGKWALGLLIVTVSALQMNGVFFVLSMALFLILLFIRKLSNECRDTGREMSMEEKWYWYQMNEFMDGRSSVYPKKPSK